MARAHLPLLGSLLAASLAAAGPCDIYGSANTPCVAAHSTTRCLYDAYNGPLYQVQKNDTDGNLQSADIHPLSAGGIADSSAQDTFCGSAYCEISIIYDQSPQGNDLTRAPKGTANSGPGPDGADALADATAAPITVGGHKVYGVKMPTKTGYRNNNAKGTAVLNEPEGMYAVLDGTFYNGNCCFDYGNVETTNSDPGDAHMETIYFGQGGHKGAGDGPWVGADLENGLFQSNSRDNVNPNNPTITYRFVTAIVKGDSSNLWAIRGGNSQEGDLGTFFNGTRPDGYFPMKKEGAIVLGVGGDNSNRGQGTFYEGVLTSGYPSDDTENQVQADIVAAGYAA